LAPGWLVVSEATERAEMTLQDRINDLARAQRFDEIEVWLERFLDLRKSGWKRGVLSLDAHLKNYGVIADRVVLLDAGGLTNDWPAIEQRLGVPDEFESPHVQLGLEMTLRDRPDNLGGALSPLVTGYLLDWSGENWNLALYVSAAIYLLGIVCWLALDSVTPLRGCEPDPVEAAA
jgi:hypothetical protein